MKNSIRVYLSLVAVSCMFACGQSPDSTKASASFDHSATGPMTIETWKNIQEEEKFSAEVLDRLKLSDPALKTPKGWKKFKDEVLNPEFKRFRGA